MRSSRLTFGGTADNPGTLHDDVLDVLYDTELHPKSHPIKLSLDYIVFLIYEFVMMRDQQATPSLYIHLIRWPDIVAFLFAHLPFTTSPVLPQASCP